MKKIYKKTISAFLLFSFLFVITVCCCLDEKLFADEIHSEFSTENHHGSHGLDNVDHSEHQNHAQGDQECACPKHLSFLSAQSVDIVLGSISQTLAKIFMANVHFGNDALLASLSSQAHGPPFQDYLDRVAIPIYLKIRNLRL